jgi:dolichol kinase
MSKEIINTILLASAFLLLFGLTELLYHKLKVKVELTRKLAHFGTGLLTLLFPVMLGNHWFVLLLCASFALILLASLKLNMLKSINAIDRKSYGSILYPVAVYSCYLFYNYHSNKNGKLPDSYIYFYLPILSLAICDPLAALFGKRFPYGKYKVACGTKTIVGSSAFYLSSVVLSVIMLTFFATHSLSFAFILRTSILIAATACLAEALSGKGTDNLTIPVSVLAALILFL